MKLAISIEAGNSAKKKLLAGLADLVPGQLFEETTGSCRSDRFILNFLMEAISPDRLLQGISEIVSGIEHHYPAEQGMDVHVRNIEGSEPVLVAGQHGKPFTTVEGFRIIAWNTGGENPAAAPYDIRLDPAHVFGTGLHPSTRLCLHFLKKVAEGNSRGKLASHAVLDIGCGSGILTIAALRLGTARALAVEIDPDAVRVARRNIQINGLARSAQVAQTSWHGVSEQFDLILANLVPSVLYKAAPHMAKLLREQGLLITAGFPAAKIIKVVRLFAKNDLHLIDESSLNGWGALLLAK